MQDKIKPLKLWKMRIDGAAAKSKDRFEVEEKMVKIYNAEHREGDTFVLPTAFTYLSAAIPKLFYRMPKMRVRAKSIDNAQYADIMESVLEYVWKKANIYDRIFEAVQSAEIKTCGFVKVGISVETEEEFDDGGEVIGENTTAQNIWVKYVENKYILIDPDAKNFEQAAWLCHIIEMAEEEFDERYSGHKDFKKIKESAQESTETNQETDGTGYTVVNGAIREDGLDGNSDPDSVKYVVYEVWDRREDKRFVVVKGYDKFVEEDVNPMPFEGFPFAMLVLRPAIDTLYPKPALKLFEAPIDVVDNMIDKQEKNVDGSKSLVIYRKTAFSEDEVETIINAEDGAYIGVERTIEDGDIRVITTSPSSPETYKIRDDMLSFVREGLHISTEDVQGKGKTQTATEVAERSQKGRILTGFKTSKIDAFTLEIIEMVMALVGEFYDHEELIKVNRKFGDKPIYQSFVGTDMGEFDFEVIAGSAAYQNEDLRMQKLMQAGEMIKGYPPEIIQGESLLKEILGEMLISLGLDSESVGRSLSQQEEENLYPGVPPDGGRPSEPPNQEMLDIQGKIMANLANNNRR